jgi:hypothetical protein
LFCGHLRRGPDLHTTDGRRESGAQICFFVVFGAVRDLLFCAKHLFVAATGPLLGRALMVRGRLAGA